MADIARFRAVLRETDRRGAVDDRLPLLAPM